MFNRTNATVFIRYNDDQTIMVHLVVDCSDDSIGTDRFTDRTTFATTIDRAYQSTIATTIATTIYRTYKSTLKSTINDSHKTTIIASFVTAIESTN